MGGLVLCVRGCGRGLRAEEAYMRAAHSPSNSQRSDAGSSDAVRPQRKRGSP